MEGKVMTPKAAQSRKWGENLLSNSRWARILPCPGALVEFITTSPSSAVIVAEVKLK